MSDRTTRLLASLALAIALVALVIAGYALSLEQERTEELHELSDSVGRALRSAPPLDAYYRCRTWRAIHRSPRQRPRHRAQRHLDRFRLASPPVEAPAADDLLSDRLQQAMEKLAEADRLLLEQKYFEAATVRDLARAAGTTEKAIESRLARARERLRTFILDPLRP